MFDRRRTDDDIRVPVREARIDKDTADFFLLAARARRWQVDIHVIGPLQPHACTPLGAQRALVAACAYDGKPNEVLYKDEAGRGEARSAQWRADEDGELQASRWREPRVGAAAAARELKCCE